MSGKRVDSNHGFIRDGLRQLGYIVEDCSAFGHGFPDLMVCDKNCNIVLLEVKTSKGKLRKQQVEFFQRWQVCPVYIVRSLEEALEVLT